MAAKTRAKKLHERGKSSPHLPAPPRDYAHDHDHFFLRAWQATPSQDFKTRHEHLLHFFEGAAEFVSVILLSAFSSNEALFGSHKKKLSEVMKSQNLSFQRATFGTWKLVVEYLGKQTRELLSENGKKPDDARNDRAVCADIFSDQSLVVPEAMSRTGLAAILSTTNKMRNDWSGHGGVVGQEEARLWNEQLLAEVQNLRETDGGRMVRSAAHKRATLSSAPRGFLQ